MLKVLFILYHFVPCAKILNLPLKWRLVSLFCDMLYLMFFLQSAVSWATTDVAVDTVLPGTNLILQHCT